MGLARSVLAAFAFSEFGADPLPQDQHSYTGENIMGRTERIVVNLNARRSKIGEIPFHCLTRRLSAEARQVFFRILGGDSLQKIVETMAESRSRQGRVQGPTKTDRAAAEAELQYLLSEIDARFQLALQSGHSNVHDDVFGG